MEYIGNALEKQFSGAALAAALDAAGVQPDMDAAEAIVKYKASSILLDLKKIDLSGERPIYDGEVLPINLFTFVDGDKVITVATTEDEYYVINL